MKIKLLLPLLLAVVFSFSANGQRNPEIDNWLQKLKTSTTDTARVSINARLTMLYFYLNADTALFYAKRSMQLYKPTMPSRYGSIAYTAMGQYYNVVGNPDSSLYYYNQSLDLATKTKNEQGEIRALINIANLYYNTGQNDKGLKNSLQALKIAEKDTLNKDIWPKANYGVSMGYQAAGMYDKALHYANVAFRSYKLQNDSINLGHISTQIGGIYYNKKDYKQSLKYNYQSIAYHKSLGDDYKYVAYSGLATSYSKLGDKENARKYFLLSYDVAKRQQDSYSLAIATINLGELAFDDKDYTTSKQYFTEAYPLALQIHSFEDIRNVSYKLAELNSMNGNYSEAYKYMAQAYSANDSLMNEQKSKDIAEMATKYESGKKDEENLRLTQDAQIKDLQINQQYIIIGALAFVLLIIIGGSVYFLRQRKFIAEQREKILEQKLLQMQLNPHFIFNSLLAIQDYIYNNNTAQAAGYLSKFSKLMRSTLENSRTETIPLFKEIEGLENYLALQKLRMGNKLHYEVIVDESVDVFGTEIPPMLIQPFVENAVEHGVQMKDGKGIVSVSFELKGTMLNISIKDDGPGMSEKARLNSSHKSLSIQIIGERLQLLAKRNKNEPAIVINSKEKLGTLIELSFPIA